MKISSEIDSVSKLIGEERAIEYYAKAGFDAWDFSMYSMCNFDWKNRCLLECNHPLAGRDYLKFARRLKQVADDNGIVCNQSHAPFPSDCREVRSLFKRTIECTAEVGGEVCVIHPDNRATILENAEMYQEILPFAKECNVKIATENMWFWDDAKDHALGAMCSTPERFIEMLDAVNDDYFTACLDIGHAEMKGIETSAAEMILALGKRLTVLHIHDNDKWHDTHMIPFSGNIDFEKIIKALKKINYQGYFTLEANGFFKNYNAENVFDGICELEKAVRKLAKMFEE